MEFVFYVCRESLVKFKQYISLKQEFKLLHFTKCIKYY